MRDDGNVTQFPHSSPPAHGNGNGNGGGKGPLILHRLSELERRMTSLEATVQSVNNTVIEMNAKLSGLGTLEETLRSIQSTVTEMNASRDGLATKTYVLTMFCVTGGLAVLTFVGHVLLRTLGS